MGGAFVKNAPAESVDVGDIQGIVRFGYGKLTEGCYLLLRIRDAAAARTWLGGALALVSTAAEASVRPETAMQVAFTSAGLRAWGVDKEVVAGFAAEFVAGMAGDESRSRRLGDTGASAPDAWDWGRPGSEPDVLVMLFAKVGLLEDWRGKVESDAFRAGFETLACLETSDLGNHEPFGFRDGISQPEIDWARRRKTGSDVLNYTNLAALGEFVLGYPNEYGKYTDRPLLDANREGAGELLPAEDQPGKKDLGRNGTYVVLRQLEQDVRGFWRYMDGASNSDEAARVRLAEAMVGRTMEGEPLEPLSGAGIEGIEDRAGEPANQFTYDGDRKGTRCPFGAHIRRANPRNADLPGQPGWWLTRMLRTLGWGIETYRDDAIASTRFHRMLRRGREYGPGLTMAEAIEEAPDGVKRGLHFVSVNANISRQFEFAQNAWLMSTKFHGLSEESDPLLGNRGAVGDCPYTGNFSWPREGKAPRVPTGLPQFVTVRGGAYFFLPSLRVLGYLANRGTQSR